VLRLPVLRLPVLRLPVLRLPVLRLPVLRLPVLGRRVRRRRARGRPGPVRGSSRIPMVVPCAHIPSGSFGRVYIAPVEAVLRD
jgi:hypothetical protein